MNTYLLQAIGKITMTGEGVRILLEDACRPALQGLEGFSHVQVLWWLDGCDNPRSRGNMVTDCPYRTGPEKLGVFATRSPERPNPLALSCARITGVDLERGTVDVDWLDAQPNSPVLDLKPYTPSLDRVSSPSVPDWCAHWPGSLEDSGDFDWEQEFWT